MLIVLNPNSGASHNEEELQNFKKFSPQIFRTTGKRDQEKIEKILKKEEHDTIVAIGGDGTINTIVQVIAGSDKKLAIVPRGSTNALFRSLMGHERPIENRIEKEIDILDIDGRYCTHIAGFGLNAHILKTSEKKGWRGFFRYIKSFFNSIFRFRINEYKVNGRKIRSMILFIANKRGYDSMAGINKTGRYDDSEFEVSTFIERNRYKEATIENIDKAPFHIDGEFIGHPGKIKVKVLHKSLKVLI
jgi:diacylglycerol kinase family enzyme